MLMIDQKQKKLFVFKLRKLTRKKKRKKKQVIDQNFESLFNFFDEQIFDCKN